MPDNNFISNNNPFNISFNLPKKSIREVKKVAENELKNLTIEPVVDYFNENDKVFSGEVAKEIRKYQFQIYSLGQIVRDGQPTRTFFRNV